jgi:hypothetical protein
MAGTTLTGTMLLNEKGARWEGLLLIRDRDRICVTLAVPMLACFCCSHQRTNIRPMTKHFCCDMSSSSSVNHLSDFHEWLQQTREAKVSFLPWIRTMLSDKTIMGMKWDDFVGKPRPNRTGKN